MYQKILIRYGELVLKKKNRKQFIQKLSDNIYKIINEKPEVEFDRMYLTYSSKNLESLKYIFGISSYSPVIVVDNDLKLFENSIIKLIKSESKTFKIQARRNNKEFEFTSDQLNHMLGAFVLKNSSLKVDVHNPNQIFYIEVRKFKTYIFSEYINGLGGLPTGIGGRAIHLLSGGFDSPVAAYLLMKRGIKLDFLSFLTPPQTDEKTIDKINELVKILTKYQGSSNLYFANYSMLLNYISLISKQAYKINIMRRSFYRIAQKLAIKKNILAISNGENLGQVASQTLESMHVIEAVTTIPILRPLVTYDKNEIINLAKKISTHDISIIKANETCELFAPKEPVTKPTIENAKKLEQELSRILELEQDLIDNKIELVKFSINN
ncbi:tRNA uracil 4-sulfurtransferase ThiI [Mycoplasmopsis cricetuli]|uniref:tRNA uracil 4-sulfurtransferase ThiI n=1 Tax=Mycoplasmopsis cricetuli TaxID=171283 RepID=UPI00046ECE8B|nr:tRNA uracil 4-sulfurtransferase ThiI [Mycoplasmopsis cricetuli]